MGLLLILLVVIVNSKLTISQAEKLEFQFRAPFNSSYNGNFVFLGNANISKEELQLTSKLIANSSSRIFFNHTFKLWEEEYEHGTTSKTTSRLASFNASFLVKIFRIRVSSVSAGEGFAFLIAPDISIPLRSHGQYLGLTNSTTDGEFSNGILAIEFDTFKQDFDPDDNHIGLDIHSVRSKRTVSLSKFGIQLAASRSFVPQSFASSMFYIIWVHYDGGNKALEVYMAEQGESKPPLPVLSANLDLRGLVNQYSYFGFAGSTGSSAWELNSVLDWNLTVDWDELPASTDGKNTSSANLMKIFAVGVPALILLLIGILCLYFFWQKKGAALLLVSRALSLKRERLQKKKIDDRMVDVEEKVLAIMAGDDKPIFLAPGLEDNFTREFIFKDLQRATKNFDSKNKLGEGSFGVVYQGVLPDDNLKVAIKMFSGENLNREENFLNELAIIRCIRHPNIVSFLGWCHKNGRWLLVYEYMPNGSLDKHLFTGPEAKVTLGWKIRYKIIEQVALALSYLHCREPMVIHRDLKPSNIMLDSNLNARLGDFGLACAVESRGASFADVGMGGTFGYIAPESFFTFKATCDSDVYSFGAVVLETVCGKHMQTNIAGFHNLVDWVWWLHRQGHMLEAVDERLVLSNDYETEEAERLLLLGLACSHPVATERPKTLDIVRIISGEVAVSVPTFKPPFVWPSAEEPETNISLNLELAADPSPIMPPPPPPSSPPGNVGHKIRRLLVPTIFSISTILRLKSFPEVESTREIGSRRPRRSLHSTAAFPDLIHLVDRKEAEIKEMLRHNNSKNKQQAGPRTESGFCVHAHESQAELSSLVTC